MNRASWLKAGGIFLASLSMAAGLGFALSALSPEPACAFPVGLHREVVDGGIQATVTHVEGDYAVVDLEYQLVLLEPQLEDVLEEGSLAEARLGSGAVIFEPRDGSASSLRAGDVLTAEGPGTLHLILLQDGVPVAWTGGCEA